MKHAAIKSLFLVWWGNNQEHCASVSLDTIHILSYKSVRQVLPPPIFKIPYFWLSPTYYIPRKHSFTLGKSATIEYLSLPDIPVILVIEANSSVMEVCYNTLTQTHDEKLA